jgi:ribosomal-protein-alanine N-acetyltransferase
VFIDLETKRFYLKSINIDDIDFIHSQFSDDYINKYLFDAEPVRSVEEARAIIDFYCVPEPKYQHRWILILKDKITKIGTCGFHCWDVNSHICEIRYDLVEEYNGAGLMSEAVDEILKYSYSIIEVRKVYANIYYENARSIKLIQKKGFLKTGEKTEVFRGKEYLHYVYTLEKAES